MPKSTHMIFDDHNPPVPPPGSPEPSRHRRRRSSSGSESSGRRRSGTSSSFREAVRLDDLPRSRPDGNAKAWLWVLGLLLVATLGFTWFLQQERPASRPLQGEAPSTKLAPFIDPILAPLEIGVTGYSTESLADLQSEFRLEGEETGPSDREVYSTAATMAQILQEALADRERHMQRLVKLGVPLAGMVPDRQTRTDLPETERRRLELAVAVSWQRNSGTYRNRVEELWYRLLRLEQGRFSPGSATMAEQPAETSSQ
ncbi:MAG: hypothetical protein O3A75_07295 [Verrucomicrobia bacterium]|jgi:hypothetical protein|nr:hypothetical protein [Verrucomicrobiota bacterium]